MSGRGARDPLTPASASAARLAAGDADGAVDVAMAADKADDRE